MERARRSAEHRAYLVGANVFFSPPARSSADFVSARQSWLWNPASLGAMMPAMQIAILIFDKLTVWGA